VCGRGDQDQKQIRLTLPACGEDNAGVPDKEGTGFERLNYTKAHEPRNAAFYVCMLSRVLNGRQCQGGFGLLASFGVPVVQTCHSPPTPFERGARCDVKHQGGKHA